MNQTEARFFITALATRSASFAPFAARAERLVTNPDDINQTVFGICGLTVMVRSLLQYDLQKFIDLLSAIFENKTGADASTTFAAVNPVFDQPRPYVWLRTVPTEQPINSATCASARSSK